MEARIVLLSVTLTTVLILSWIYINAIQDSSFDRKTGFTISAVIDSPERQLVMLVAVVILAFCLSTALYETGRYRVSSTVPLFGLFAITLVFATLLTRLSWMASVHYGLAFCAFFFIFLTGVAMASFSHYRVTALILAVISGLIFVPAIVVRISTKQYVRIEIGRDFNGNWGGGVFGVLLNCRLSVHSSTES